MNKKGGKMHLGSQDTTHKKNNKNNDKGVLL